VQVVDPLGLSPTVSPRRLEFTRDMREAVATADFVQEVRVHKGIFEIPAPDPSTPSSHAI
jgi:hypothetical protein